MTQIIHINKPDPPTTWPHAWPPPSERFLQVEKEVIDIGGVEVVRLAFVFRDVPEEFRKQEVV